jgi:hypothetical protein
MRALLCRKTSVVFKEVTKDTIMLGTQVQKTVLYEHFQEKNQCLAPTPDISMTVSMMLREAGQSLNLHFSETQALGDSDFNSHESV